jgi:hypothetical protein
VTSRSVRFVPTVLEIERDDGFTPQTVLVDSDRTRRVDKNYDEFRHCDMHLNWWWRETELGDAGGSTWLALLAWAPADDGAGGNLPELSYPGYVRTAIAYDANWSLDESSSLYSTFGDAARGALSFPATICCNTQRARALWSPPSIRVRMSAARDDTTTMDVYAQLEQRAARSHGTSFDRIVRRAREQLETASEVASGGIHWATKPKSARCRRSRAAYRKRRTPRFAGPSPWRDPDSNWGHHDFQEPRKTGLMARNSGEVMFIWLDDFTPILRLFSGHWATRQGFVAQCPGRSSDRPVRPRTAPCGETRAPDALSAVSRLGRR